MRKTLKESSLYEIDSIGNIYNKSSGRKLKGRNLIHLDRCRRRKMVVANNLIDNPNNYKNVVHIDGNTSNYLLSNLEWSNTVYGKPIFDKETDKYIRFKIAAIIPRCHSKKDNDWKNYGKKGIFVCEEWRKNTLEFVKWSKSNDFYKGAWLLRYDKTKGYSPENCFWGKPEENNKLNCDMVFDIKERVKTTSCNIVAKKYSVSVERIRQLKKGSNLKNCN